MQALLFQLHDSYACAAELNVLVVEGDDAGNGCEVLTDDLPQGSCACAVKDSNASNIDQQSIIDEVGDGLQGFVHSHASHINLLLEVKMLLPDAVLSLAANHYRLSRFLFYGVIAELKPFEVH